MYGQKTLSRPSYFMDHEKNNEFWTQLREFLRRFLEAVDQKRIFRGQSQKPNYVRLDITWQIDCRIQKFQWKSLNFKVHIPAIRYKFFVVIFGIYGQNCVIWERKKPFSGLKHPSNPSVTPYLTAKVNLNLTIQVDYKCVLGTIFSQSSLCKKWDFYTFIFWPIQLWRQLFGTFSQLTCSQVFGKIANCNYAEFK